MKHVYIYALFLFVLIACNKDTIDVKEDVVTDPPTEVKGPFVEGIIRNIVGEPMSQVVIDIYQDNKKIGSTQSDAKGKYHTIGTEIKGGTPVTLKYSKADFNTSFRRMTFEEDKGLKRNVHLASLESFKSQGTNEIKEIENPDSTFIKIFGYLKSASGEPIAGAKCYLSGRFIPELDWFNIYATAVSDENGYVELLAKKDSEFMLRAWYNMFPSRSISIGCNYLLHDSDTPLGPFSEEHQIQFANDAIIEKVTKTFKGKALKCNGDPVRNGKVNLSYRIDENHFFPYGQSFADSTFQFGPEGDFEITLSSCNYFHKGDYRELKAAFVLIEDNDAVDKTGTKTIDISQTTDFGIVELCDDPNEYPFDFDLTLGDESFSDFESSGDYFRSGKNTISASFTHIQGDIKREVFLKLENIAIGSVPIKHLIMNKYKILGENYFQQLGQSFNIKDSDLNCTITKIEDRYVYGNIDVDVDTPDGVKPLLVNFKIYDK